MFNYVLRRLLYAIPVLLVGSMILFGAVRATFDPTAKLRNSRDGAAAVAREKHRLGLDQPLVKQYGTWLKDFVSGNWGESSRTHDSVSSMIQQGLSNTVQLLFWGVLISLIVAVSVGVYSAVRQYSISDYVFTSLSYIGIAMPPFWFGLIAIQLFAVWPYQHFNLSQPPLYFIGLHGEGQSGFNMDYIRHLILPVATLTVQIIASWSRFQRASMLDVLNADYVRTAQAKGVPRRKVIGKHALRNALIPLVTVVALDAGALFGGLIITETIFTIPGMGRLFFDSLQAGDANVLLAWFVVTAMAIVIFNLIADVLYGVLDPRIRLQ